jgi:hypothetical protein
MRWCSRRYRQPSFRACRQALRRPLISFLAFGSGIASRTIAMEPFTLDVAIGGAVDGGYGACSLSSAA